VQLDEQDLIMGVARVVPDEAEPEETPRGW
jgi:hypothetical protein